MKVRVAQIEVTKDISDNLQKILDTLKSSSKGEWVLLPEGMLSGYYPEQTNYLNQLDAQLIETSIKTIGDEASNLGVNCLCGSARKMEDKWYNCTIAIVDGRQIVYRKNNLSTLDRNHFTPGDSIKTFQAEDMTFGIQMCRDLVYPEQWKLLKKKGAQVI